MIPLPPMQASVRANRRTSAPLLLVGAALTVVAVVTATAGAQPVASRTLGKPEAEFSEPFSQVAAVRELRNGRVVVADSRDKIVQVVDLRSGSATKVGREGSGPGEYGLPMAMFALPGDSAVVFDPINQRYLMVTPDGKAGVTFRIGDDDGAAPRPQQRAAGDPGQQTVRIGGLGMGFPRASDARGRLYFEGPGLSFGPEGPVPADSSPVIRYDRATRRFDTLAYVRLPKNNAQVSSTGNAQNRNVNVRIGTRTPYPARDTWTVLPNGSVAVVRVADYHVDIISPTRQVTRGPAVPYTPVRVGNAEKEEYRQQARNSPGIAISRTSEQSGSGPARTQSSAGPPPFEEPAEWPAVKPAFANTALAAPNGELWVQRNGRAGEAPTYDVFSAAGRLVGRVVLPKRSRVVGFGTGTVYTTRSDDDDLQYLQRYRI